MLSAVSKVSCQAVRSLTSRLRENAQTDTRPPTLLSYMFRGLKPATMYRCSVAAATVKGTGRKAVVNVWTDPQGRLVWLVGLVGVVGWYGWSDWLVWLV